MQGSLRERRQKATQEFANPNAIAAEVGRREDRLKGLLATNLRHGDRKEIARLLGYRPESVSRMLSHDGRERLSVSFVAVAEQFVRLRGDAPATVVHEMRSLLPIERRRS